MDNSNIPSGDDNVKIYNGKNNEMQLKFCHGLMSKTLQKELIQGQGTGKALQKR